MTRETKIGLLVGLVFIIVVGILLSEHLTSATEKPSAALAEAGRSVRQGVSAPGVTTSLEAPQQTVPTSRDFGTPVNNNGVTQIQTPQTGNNPPIIITNNGNNGTPGNTYQFQQPSNTNGGNVISVGINPQNPENTSQNNFPGNLNDIAHQHGEDIVGVNNGNSSKPPVSLNNGNNNGNTTTDVREYKAQPGDSLSRIAALLPGGNTKDNRAAIVKLNPTLQKDPNKIIAGRTYQLPVDPKTVANNTPPTTPTHITPPVTTVTENKPTQVDQRIYVVKKGDTLTRIATEQLGSATEVATIKSLNDDVLKGTDLIHPDMKLKLPAKPLASTN